MTHDDRIISFRHPAQLAGAERAAPPTPETRAGSYEGAGGKNPARFPSMVPCAVCSPTAEHPDQNFLSRPETPMDPRRPGCPACREALAEQAAELMRMGRALVVCTPAYDAKVDALMQARVGLMRDTSSAVEMDALRRDVRFWQTASIEQTALGIVEAALLTVGEAEALGRLEDYINEAKMTPIERRDLRLLVFEKFVWRDHAPH